MIKDYFKNLLIGFLIPSFLTYDILSQSLNYLLILPIFINGFLFPIAILAVETAIRESNHQNFWNHYKNLPTFGSSGLYAIYWLIVSLLTIPITIIYLIFIIIKKGR